MKWVIPNKSGSSIYYRNQSTMVFLTSQMAPHHSLEQEPIETLVIKSLFPRVIPFTPSLKPHKNKPRTMDGPWHDPVETVQFVEALEGFAKWAASCFLLMIILLLPFSFLEILSLQHPSATFQTSLRKSNMPSFHKSGLQSMLITKNGSPVQTWTRPVPWA